MVKGKGAFFPAFVNDRHVLGREFLRSPSEFAKRHGVDPDDLKCPPEAHAAFERGSDFAEKVKAADLQPDDESMEELQQLARASFGDDFAVSLIPFGLQFREPANIVGADITATGSGTITWLDTDADVDG